ncbi:MAG: DDE-type integrase/transposase/recombinase [bacterium]|nr:DDE-type integrase/transposase/recombinase [bacterium]
MKKVDRFIIWICSKFTSSEIEQIIQGLSDILADRNPDVKPKDDFKQKHPNYRNFFVDPESPLTTPPKSTPKLNYKDLLVKYEKENGRHLQPVNPKKPEAKTPQNSICKICSAPAQYLYYNNGKKRSQLKCKVCGSLNQLYPRHRIRTKYFCPHCGHALYLWKERKDVSIYKCDNDKCPVFLSNKVNLNFAEKLLAKIKSSQFKLRYQFREYHFTNEQMIHSAPQKSSSLFDIRKSLNTLCLILTFHISTAISARKTAFILKNVFSIPCSYQTVLNYAQSAAYYCHKFNFAHKGDVDDTQAGDETYIKVSGKNNYTFLFISSKSRKITAYHVDETRDTLPATIAMNEAVRTALPNQNITLVTDGNPSYLAGIHFINQSLSPNLTHKKVIGLQNLDSESEEFRPFKQLIERLNRTYKFHTKSACGFNTKNGAIALTTLFVTHYNFLRPHCGLRNSVPIPLKNLQDIDTLQGKWAEILQMSFSLN